MTQQQKEAREILVFAIERGYPAWVKIALEHGAPVNRSLLDDAIDGRMIKKWQTRIEILKILLPKVETLSDSDKKNLIVIAESGKLPEVAAFLKSEFSM